MPQTTDDRCPGVLRLHDAVDGRLARIRLPGGMLGARQLDALARAARLGTDIVELTSRASVQIRGLAPAGPCPDAAGRTSDATSAELRQILAGGGLLPSATHDRIRNILASPLAGRDPQAVAPTDALVAELDRLICADPRLAGLPGRFVFEVDDGSRVGRAAAADVTLRARADASRHDPVFQLVLAGIAIDLTAPWPTPAAELAVAAARAFLDLRDEADDPKWRLRDLPGAAVEIARRLGGAPEAPATSAAADSPEPRRRAVAVGVIEQRDGRRAVTALARLGRLDAVQLDGLAELCRTPAGVRLSPWKTVTLLDVAPAESATLVDRLTRLGLVVSPGSPWVGLTACAGTGACAKSRLDVRRLAAARAAAGRLGETEHWSGCERRCGEPADARIAVAPNGPALAVRIDGVDHRVDTPADALDLLGAGVAAVR